MLATINYTQQEKLLKLRRKFYGIIQAIKAPSLADEALEFIGKLYQIERNIVGRPYDHKRFYHKRHVMPILKSFNRLA